MSEPTNPGVDPEEYAAALDRLLDGLPDESLRKTEGTGPADAAVRADTDAIARALGLIGGALTAEDSGSTAAAAPLPPAAAGGTVVAMSSWRSKLNPRVLAAAASLVVLLGVGIPLAVSSTGGPDAKDATTALGVPESAADRSAGSPMSAPAPQAGAHAENKGGEMSAEALTSDDAAAEANAAPRTTTGSAGAATTGSGGPEPAAPAAKNGADAARQAATPQFADAVACARGIVAGTITAVQPAPDGAHYDVTVLVEDWIEPKTGPVSVTYRVFGSTANSPGEDETVRVGLRRLFVVAASEEERIYAFRPKDWSDTKQRIAAIRAERAGQSC